MPNEPILPTSIRVAASPGETTNQDFVVQARLPSGSLIATVIGDGTVFRLREFVAYKMVRERLSDEEFMELPPNLRNEAHRWSVTFDEVARAGSGTPLSVSPELHVHGIIDFFAPAAAAPGTYTATLVVDGLQPSRVEIPLLFAVGGIGVEFLVNPIVAYQNSWMPLPVRVTLPGAPDTDLTLAVTHGYAEVPPTQIRVPSGGSATVTLQLLVLDNAPLGPLSTLLTVTGHTSQGNYVPFVVMVRPPVHPPELDHSHAIQRIHQHYLNSGGRTGPLGYPTSEVLFAGNTATRRYRGGTVKATMGDGPLGVITQGLVTQQARITFVGFKCISESNELSAHDEPYFVITVDNADGLPKTQKFGPYENIDAGTEVGIGATLIQDFSPNPMSVRVQAYENDSGDPDQTARNIQDKMVEMAQAAQSVAAQSGADAADGPGVGPSAAAGGVAGFLAGPLGALLASGVVSLLGLGDDWIGQSLVLVFAYPDEAHTPDRIDRFQGQEYNKVVDIDGGDEGHHQLYFWIEVREQDPPHRI
jgi:hypothetical protein